MAPQGRFFVPIEPAARRHHVRHCRRQRHHADPVDHEDGAGAASRCSRFTLIYGNRMLRSTMFKEELEDLKNRYMTRLVLHHVFSDEPTDAPLNMGADEPRQDRRVPAPACCRPIGIDQVYVCGPFQMNDEAEAALLAAGVPEERIHIERFGVATPAGAPVGAVVHEAKPGDAEQARIVIIRDGMRREIEFRKDQPSILDAASAAGLEVPFSCTSPACAAPAAPSWWKARCAWSATSRSTRPRSPPASCSPARRTR